MAKKFVRGITDIKTINNQDFDTNNVNDLLSDGEHNYIHRKKKDKSEEYHNLTDNIKTISSSNTDLIEVDNNNTTNNTATLKPKHDAKKEQVLESTRNTVTISHGSNATSETTKVDTNPEKVLEHDNLTVADCLTKVHTGNTTNLSVDPVKVLEHDNLISDSEYVTITHQSGETTSHIQTAKLKEELDDLYTNKQDVLVAGNGINIEGQIISSSGGGASSSFAEFGTKWLNFYTIKHNVEDGHFITTTFTINAEPGIGEMDISGPLATQIKQFVPSNKSISNGAITITNDGTNIKFTNTSSSGNTQQGTFTFYTLR